MAELRASVLLVDDEEDFLRHAASILERRGLEVIAAADGAAALEQFERRPHSIDIVITDIKMPGMDGRQLIKKLREKRRDLPIIGITGVRELANQLALLDDGAYYYLEKPLSDPKILYTLVDNAVRFGRHERKRLEVARMVRSYLVQRPAGADAAAAARGRRRLAYDIALSPLASDEPSGDYVECFERHGDELLFYVADASGHHDLVATFLALMSSLVLHRLHHAGPPAVDAIILAIDDALGHLRGAGALEDSRFLTFFIGVVDLGSGELSYVNAAHPPAFLLRPVAADQPVVHQRLASTCAAVGLMSQLEALPPPRVGRQRLAGGDLLFVYTDGASELLQGEDRPQDGVDRLAAALEPLATSSPEEIVGRLSAHLRGQTGDGGLPDDTTLMAIRFSTATGGA